MYKYIHIYINICSYQHIYIHVYRYIYVYVYMYMSIKCLLITYVTQWETPGLLCVHALGPGSGQLEPLGVWGPRIRRCTEPLGP